MLGIFLGPKKVSQIIAAQPTTKSGPAGKKTTLSGHPESISTVVFLPCVEADPGCYYRLGLTLVPLPCSLLELEYASSLFSCLLHGPSANVDADFCNFSLLEQYLHSVYSH